MPENKKGGEANSSVQRLPESNLGLDNAQPPPSLTGAKPVLWQWRAMIGGKWGSWSICKDVEAFKNGAWKFNLANGTAELRPLYAAPTERDGSGLSEEERSDLAFIRQAKDQQSHPEAMSFVRKLLAIIDRLTGGKS